MNKKKILVLIRHAKSSWSDKSLSDFDRPLKKRGKKNALLMGKRLAEKNLFPDLFVTSSAKRAKNTAIRIARELQFSQDDIHYFTSLYYADNKDLLQFVAAIEEGYETVFIVGHNNTITDVANILSKNHIANVPTAGCVAFSVDGSWENMCKERCSLLFFEYPRLFD